MINFIYLFKFFECGHFCIKYVLRKDRKNKKIKYCKQLMSLSLVKKILKEYYSECDCYFINDIKDLKGKEKFITLIKTRGKYMHYIVINSIGEKYIKYYDPLFINCRKVKIDKFKQIWSHYCCFFF